MKVAPYSSAELIRLLAESSEADEAFLLRKAHRRFFEGYLAQLGAQTIVVEPVYTDRDYLHDYAGYYVSCFHAYKRTTARLHFFDKAFDLTAFTKLLTGDLSQLTALELQDAYLGFIVVKPLPKTVIGRTCLRTYPLDAGRRHFPVVQEYFANLFGIQLKVSSLAFQEQDSVAAACATSALWSCFHATGKYFHHPILSPTDITKAALVSLPTTDVPDTRAFPNRGLSATQMANAVNAVGMDPQIVGAKDEHLVKSTLYAYLKGKIPVLLGIVLIDYDVNNVQHRMKSMGQHAVATAGYSTGAPAPVPYGAGFKLYASRIDKLYVHDDQLGPFARMSFKSLPGSEWAMSTEWESERGAEVIAAPKIMLLPLYRKIRIPFEIVHDTILELDGLLEAVRAQFFSGNDRPEWDIYLTTVTDFKSETLAGTNGLGKDALLALRTALPKFLWRVSATCGGVPCCDFLFDATGIEQSSLLLLAKIYSADLMTMLQALAANPTVGARQTFHVLECIAAGSKLGTPLIFGP